MIFNQSKLFCCNFSLLAQKFHLIYKFVNICLVPKDFFYSILNDSYYGENKIKWVRQRE